MPLGQPKTKREPPQLLGPQGVRKTTSGSLPPRSAYSDLRLATASSVDGLSVEPLGHSWPHPCAWTLWGCLVFFAAEALAGKIPVVHFMDFPHVLREEPARCLSFWQLTAVEMCLLGINLMCPLSLREVFFWCCLPEWRCLLQTVAQQRYYCLSLKRMDAPLGVWILSRWKRFSPFSQEQ